MENRETEEAAIRKLVSLMHGKGYRGRFSIDFSGRRGQKYHGNLRQCLAQFFAAGNGQDESPAKIELETTAPYNHRIICKMGMDYSEESGFSIREMEIHHVRTKERKHFRLRSDRDLPGAMTLESMFPKPKPWDWMLKGKFRP
ncbi:hypothetical protein JHJ32_07385 [Parapedobacter sp. ISTM3]|uniref:hypothetical protein n=1 Tax=Parapedobacter sp. ISTM3 TaxID=2800130 RepID=UPI00190829AB|nr:hypothetical protein [Parapedobacter sp. ISTM3]MBK1439800.1 hypothetical protein [Parapedobacter sp. ISTM3]